MAEVKDFLNPNSMLTPGIAGGITMMIANALWVNFGLMPKYTALVLCLLLGLVVLAELKVPIWQKPIYYIINVLVIFSVSAGTNVVGMTANQTNLVSQSNQVNEEKVTVSFSLPDISGFFISNAVAQEAVTKDNTSTTKKPGTDKKIEKPPKKIIEKPSSKQKPAVNAKQQGRQFFRSWF